MANKRTSLHRHVNVAVPLDCGRLAQLLSRGVGGAFAAGFAEKCSKEFIPIEWEIDPRTYSCPDTFRRDYLLGVILSKFDDEKSSVEKKDKALEKFHLAEERCRQVNRNFKNFVGGSLTKSVTVEACLYTASRKIQRLLGPLNLDEIALGFGFGPGASTRLGRRHSDSWYKFQGNPEATPNCAAFASAVFQHFPLWNREVSNGGEVGKPPFCVVRANRVVTVPKNAKIDRIIAIEPDLNLFVQKGFGAVISARLKKVGIDLNDQSLNQVLAKQGSIDGSLATLDLSMASDTISTSIVEQLLPPDWLQALEQCRSPEGVLPCGRIIRYHKFSSMGNGFTFELESLIFWALASSVADLLGEMDGRVSVYGDDIIVPTGIVEAVTGLLTFCGFTLNPKKSFSDGPFRESCGKHYFLGADVTPFYIRKSPRRLSDAFLLHNNVVRWSVIGESFRDEGQQSGLFDFCQTIRKAVPASWYSPRIPLGYGDGAFVGSFDECCPERAPRGFCGWRAKVLTEPKLSTDRGGSGRLLKSLFGLERQPGSLQWDVMENAKAALLVRRGQGRRAVYALYGTGTVPEIVDLPLRVGEARRRVFGTVPGPSLDVAAGKRIQRLLRFDELVLNVPLTSRAKITKILVTQWADLGPWF